MKILHFSSAIFPIDNGGTEAYIENLINEQKKSNKVNDVLWAVHKNGILNSKKSLLNNDKKIIAPISSNRLQSFSGDCSNFKSFEELLKSYSPDIVHLHNFNHKCGINHAILAKKFKCKLIITIHTTPCRCLGNATFYNDPKLSGKFNDRLCSANHLYEKGIPKPLAFLISHQKYLALNPENQNIISRVLTCRTLTNKLHSNYKNFLEIADKIHVYANWLENLIYNQGIPKNKVVLIRQGISKKILNHKRKLMEDGVFKLIFFGRCDEQKGIHIIVKAIKQLSSKVPISLDIYSSGWSGGYSLYINKLIKGDKRFNIRIGLNKDLIKQKLNEYDLVVIPSLWFETGPLVALEALSARIPIAATDRGGLKETLENVDNCFLVKPISKCWRDLFLKIILKKGEKNEVKCIPQHTFKNVAEQMFQNLY